MQWAAWRVAWKAGLKEFYWADRWVFWRAGPWVVMRAVLRAASKAERWDAPMVGNSVACWAVPRAALTALTRAVWTASLWAVLMAAQ